MEQVSNKFQSFYNMARPFFLGTNAEPQTPKPQAMNTQPDQKVLHSANAYYEAKNELQVAHSRVNSSSRFMSNKVKAE